MTTPTSDALAKTTSARFRLPDISPCGSDEVTRFDSLFKPGNSHYRALH